MPWEYLPSLMMKKNTFFFVSDDDQTQKFFELKRTKNKDV